jgi:hypothetical protein
VTDTSPGKLKITPDPTDGTSIVVPHRQGIFTDFVVIPFVLIAAAGLVGALLVVAIAAFATGGTAALLGPPALLVAFLFSFILTDSVKDCIAVMRLYFPKNEATQ